VRVVQCIPDYLHDSIVVLQHIVVPKAQHAIAVSFQTLRTHRIFLNSIAVLPAINFDHQARFKTYEIRNVALDGELTAEFEAGRVPSAQQFPKMRFGIRHISP
jgi:hypothetical protein